MPKIAKTAKLAHHPLSASTCERWWECPGSVGLIPLMPEGKGSFYASEGTVAHALASDYLLGVKPRPQDRIGEIVKVGDFEFEVTQEMIDAVNVYLRFVLGLKKQHGLLKDQLMIEKRIKIPIAYQTHSDLFGTADCILVVPFHRIIVVDYKHGAGVKVYVARNKQLMYYALGAFLAIPEELRCDIPIIEMAIVQPRAPGGDNVERIEIPTQELLEFYEGLKDAVARVVPGADLSAGDHCKWCPAKPICPAMKDLVVDQAGIDFADVQLPAVRQSQLPQPGAMDPETVARILNHEDMIVDWLKSVRQYAYGLAYRGLEIPGYTLAARRSNRRWIDKEEAKRVLKPIFGDAIFTEPDILGPAPIEKMVKAAKKTKGKLPANLDLNSMIEKPDAGMVLVKGESSMTITVSDFDEIA